MRLFFVTTSRILDRLPKKMVSQHSPQNFVSNCFWGHPVLYFFLLLAFKLRGIERKGRQEPEGSNEKVVKGEIDPSETFPNKNDPPCQEINGATEKWV